MKEYLLTATLPFVVVGMLIAMLVVAVVCIFIPLDGSFHEDDL